MRAHESRQRTVVRAGDRRKTYDADRLEDISTRSSPDRYEARILMERVAREDMDTRTLHQLRVTNTAGTTTFEISIDTDRSCQCRWSSGGPACSGRGCDDSQSPPSGPSGTPGELQPLLTSCLALGSSLLDTYSPEGSRRPSRETEREFEAKVTDFYREVSCAGFGRQIFDLYQLKKQKAEPLKSHGLVFTKLDPTGGVQVVKTRGAAENAGDELLKAAKDIVNKAEILEVQAKVEASTTTTVILVASLKA